MMPPSCRIDRMWWNGEIPRDVQAGVQLANANANANANADAGANVDAVAGSCGLYGHLAAASAGIGPVGRVRGFAAECAPARDHRELGDADQAALYRPSAAALSRQPCVAMGDESADTGRWQWRDDPRHHPRRGHQGQAAATDRADQRTDRPAGQRDQGGVRGAADVAAACWRVAGDDQAGRLAFCDNPGIILGE